jgi:hypothetical protein
VRAREHRLGAELHAVLGRAGAQPPLLSRNGTVGMQATFFGFARALQNEALAYGQLVHAVTYNYETATAVVVAYRHCRARVPVHTGRN